ncbi:MAG TPA: phosphatidate cytidylyltransferase [Candidatus Brocadiia bacterium]|nr:phosphatidate cytidylyltransferase [Candidatus Brocadiia bacterium]
MKSILGKTIVGIVVLSITLSLIAVDHFFGVSLGMFCLIGTIAALAQWEFYALAGRDAIPPAARITCIAFGLSYLAFHAHLVADRNTLAACVPFLLAAIFLSHYMQRGYAGMMKSLALSITGFVYVPFMLGHIFDVRHAWGLKAALALMLIAKIGDTGGWAFGKLFGGPKMAPRISPNKTWAGYLGSIVFSVAVAVLTKKLGLMDFLPMGKVVILGLVLGAITPPGDLAESMLKRDAAVKDSGLIPSMGGFLDLADSPIFSFPAAYYLMLALA